MARRMFSDEITTSDAFLDMPTETQLLYFHLGMNADDDGFIANTKMIQRSIGASDDSIKLLFAKKFLIAFDNGICVIKHWRINNFIRKDIYKSTKYITEKERLFIRENGAYTLRKDDAIAVPRGHFTVDSLFEKESMIAIPETTLTERQRTGYVGKVRKGKVSIDKDSVKFVRPTLEEVSNYCLERKNSVSPQKFIDHYESNGWKIGGRGAMKDWKAAVRTWEGNNFDSKSPSRISNVLSTTHTKTLADKMAERASKN